MRIVRYKESCLHFKLIRQHKRHLSLKQRDTIDVYPQIMIDIPKISLTPSQLNYLSNNGQSDALYYLSSYAFAVSLSTGPNYIRPNQSYLYSYQHRQKQIQQEHKNMMDVISSHLISVHHIPSTAMIIKKFSQELEISLRERHTAPLSYLDIYRARKELKLRKSTQYRLKKGKYILRVTDKSGIFHIGDAIDYEKKAEAYREKTQAYIELESNPLWNVFDKVVHLLNDLRSKKHIYAWQYEKMIPKREKVELAYLYFIPKPHKVIFPSFLSLIFIFSAFLARNSLKTHCLVNEYTNNWNFQIFRSINSSID